MDVRPVSSIPNPLSHNDFFALAEEMWSGWLRDELEVPSFDRDLCDVETSPEPYLIWGAAERPLVLTTNPGSTLPHHLRRNILSGSGVARPDEPYSTAARRLVDWYKEHLWGAARRRLDGMLEVADGAIRRGDAGRAVSVPQPKVQAKESVRAGG